MKKTTKIFLVSLAVCFFLEVTEANAQVTFGPPVKNPFQLGSLPNSNTTLYITHIVAVDLDDDGDYDLSVAGGDSSLVVFENIGDSIRPDFSINNSLRPPLFDQPPYQWPVYVDTDGDGDLDCIMDHAGTPYYIDNEGSSSVPSYGTPTKSPFNIPITISATEVYLLSNVVDYDNDGDFDLISSGVYYGIGVHINDGSSTAPQFGSFIENPNGFTMPLMDMVMRPNFVDFDKDGDLDILASSASNWNITIPLGQHFLYYENTGSREYPDYSKPPLINPFSIDPVGQSLLASTMCDIDSDGDLDIFTISKDSIVLNSHYLRNDTLLHFHFYENLGAPVGIDQKNESRFQVYPTVSTGQFSILANSSHTQIEKLDITVFSTEGAIVSTARFSNPNQLNMEVNLSGLPKGVYLLQIVCEEKVYTQKIVLM